MIPDTRTDKELAKELARLNKQVEVWSNRRRMLPPGSSRARVTTANAKWAIACEARDRVEAEVVRRLANSVDALMETK